MTRKAKIAVAVVLIILVGGVGANALRGGNRGGIEVRAETVATRRLVATVTASGWIRPHRAVDIQSDIMGRITDLWVAEGDSVKTGQVLLRIDPTEYEAAVSRARAAVSESMAREAQTRANLLQAERSLERSRAIAGRDSTLVSRQALEEASTQVAVQRELLEAATHGVAQARAAHREAENRLAKTTIRAPIDGIVTRRNVEVGETAIVGTMNNPGSLLLTISDLSVMEAVIRVDETDVPSLHLGDSASVEIDAFPRQQFAGRVNEIAHSSVLQRKSGAGAAASASQTQAVDFEVVVTLTAPPPMLRPDLSATAQVVTATRDSALSIPIIALAVREKKALETIPQESGAGRDAAADASRKGDEEGVFVIREGKVHFTPVEVGIAGTEHFEIKSGLVAGDSVVAGPYEVIRRLEDGKAVRTMPALGKQVKPEAKS